MQSSPRAPKNYRRTNGDNRSAPIPIPKLSHLLIHSPRDPPGSKLSAHAGTPVKAMPDTLQSFGDADPTSDALSPWLWIPLVSTALLCVLFICFRRAQSLELYERLRTYTLSRLPGGIHLGRPVPTDDLELALDSDSDDDGPTRERDDDDELPSALPSPKPTLLQRGTTVLETLGWIGERKDRGWSGDRDAGIAKAFWGVRRKDRTGGIRLAEEGQERLGGDGGRNVRRGGRAAFGGAVLERVGDVGSPAVANSAVPASPRASSSPTLFDLGEEDEEAEGDAVELPRKFELPADSPWSGERRSSGQRGMQRME